MDAFESPPARGSAPVCLVEAADTSANRELASSRGHGPFGDATLSAETWNLLLESVASGAQEAVVCAPSGRRIVLISELALLELRRRGGPRRAAPMVWLTSREQQILLLLEEGKTAADVAKILKLVANTVAQHLASARGKCRVHTTREAVQASRLAGNLDTVPSRI